MAQLGELLQRGHTTQGREGSAPPSSEHPSEGGAERLQADNEGPPARPSQECLLAVVDDNMQYSSMR